MDKQKINCKKPIVVILCLTAASAVTMRAAWAQSRIVAESALLKVSEQVAVPTRTAGVLASFRAAEGDVVTTGDLLAEVDSTEAKLVYERAVIEHELSKQLAASDIDIRSAETQLGFAVKEHQRMKRAADELPGSISTSEVEESLVTAKQAELDLELARQDHDFESLNERLKWTEREIALRKLEEHRIEAPIGGVVVEVLRRRGEWVEPGEDVLRITRIDRLRVEGLVPYEAVTDGLQGALVEIAASLPDGRVLKAEGEVTFVNPEVNPVSGRVRVRAEFDNPDGLMLPGMRVSMAILPAGGEQ